MAEVAACCGSGSKRLLAHIWVHQEAECRGHCQSAGFHPFSPLSIYSGPPAYGMLLPTFQSGSSFNFSGNILTAGAKGVSPR